MVSRQPTGPSDFSNPRAGIGAFQITVSRLILRTVAVGAPAAAASVAIVHIYQGTGSARNWLFLVLALALGAVSWRESHRARPQPLLPLIAMVVVIVGRALSADLFVAVALLVPLFVVGMMGSFSLPDRDLRIFNSVFFGLAGVAVVSYVIRFDASSEVWRGIVAAVVGAGLGLALIILLRRANRQFVARYESLYDGVSIGLVRFSTEGRLIAANRQLTRMLGYESVGELEDSDVRSFVFDADDLRRAEELVRTGESGEIKLRNSDGDPVWVQVTFDSITGSEDAPLGFEGFVKDVTESRLAEASAQRAQARFATVFESAPIGMALVDETGVVIRANRAFSMLVGTDQEMPNGIRWEAVLDGQLGNAKRFFDPDWSEESELKVVTPLGGRLSLRLHVARPPGQSTKNEFVIVQLLDVTPHVDLQTVLRDQVRAKNDFIATVSHELRTPLTAVVGFLDELPNSLGDLESESAEMLEIISSEARSLSNIVEDLLVAARADLDQLAVREETVAVADVVERVVRASTRIARDHGAVVTAEDVKPALAVADPGRVEQILWNLLTNAVRHGGERITIGTEQRGQRVAIWVRDDGPGLSTEIADSVFEPFRSFAGDNGVTTSMGLGLYVVQKLAELMRGSVAATSNNGYTEFLVDLPAANVSARATIDA
ncbi:MAG: PAS domain S-box protein [Acidimicrobiia bacterium]|nr:PAS domain S-box protein [Acidimicrobiia bacterium]